jgi:aspartyl-tRNA(Asn)/glutamyl-tRNA(Gln) amidotransferase subunit B
VQASASQVDAYRKGKTTLIGWFVGQVMRQTGGKADPQRTRAILEEILASDSGA